MPLTSLTRNSSPRRCSIAPAMVAAHGARTGTHEAPSECGGNWSAADVYRRFVRPFRGKAPLSPHKPEIVQAGMFRRHPSVRWLRAAQSALDDLANHWKLGSR